MRAGLAAALAGAFLAGAFLAAGGLAGAGAVAGPNDCNGTATQTAYYGTAVPATLGSTGSRAFATNQGGTIWQDTAGVAPAEPFAVAGTVSPIQ